MQKLLKRIQKHRLYRLVPWTILVIIGSLAIISITQLSLRSVPPTSTVWEFKGQPIEADYDYISVSVCNIVLPVKDTTVPNETLTTDIEIIFDPTKAGLLTDQRLTAYGVKIISFAGAVEITSQDGLDTTTSTTINQSLTFPKAGAWYIEASAIVKGTFTYTNGTTEAQTHYYSNTRFVAVGAFGIPSFEIATVLIAILAVTLKKRSDNE